MINDAGLILCLRPTSLLLRIYLDYIGCFYLSRSKYSTVVREGGCRFMAAWVKEEEKASEHRQRKIEKSGTCGQG